ncbi:hypothetical protein ACPV3A_16515 [Paenibacillus sp. Dod16]|uniref:hypothetical protein n=1 Tax=Paenibacillus sp. Dod16 TaxID=3416392 RepID=UPI003CE7E6C5
MSRDWQKDMETVERFKYFQTLCHGIPMLVHGQTEAPEPVEVALEYWLQQYAAEERHNVKLCKQILETELREKKLREAIDKAIREYGLWHDEGSAANVMVEILHNAVTPLYPKEETKP